MHILHIETGRHLYGGALQVLFLLRGLAGAGCRNSLACPSGSAIASAAGTCSQLYEVPVRGELDAAFMLRLRDIIAVGRPDLVHVHSRRGADLWGGLAAWSRGVPSLITRRVDNPENPLVARLKYRLYDRIITISEAIRQVLLSEGVAAEKIICVPSAVDHRRYATPCDRNWFLREFGLQATDRTIGMIAQFIPRKGHRFLIEAAPDIIGRCPAARFLFFGKGSLLEEVRNMCDRNRIGDRMVFAGFRTDLERVLPCLDLVVHPARMEGLGVSLLQAAAAGIPVVATRVGGIPEIVQDNVNGYLIDVGDRRAIMRRIIELLADPEKAQRFGSTGRMIVRSRFSIDAMVKGNLAVYRQMLSA
ncbi:MAG: glycosyltransferase family 4 protein [Desulfobacterales bacterium]